MIKRPFEVRVMVGEWPGTSNTVKRADLEPVSGVHTHMQFWTEGEAAIEAEHLAKLYDDYNVVVCMLNPRNGWAHRIRTIMYSSRSDVFMTTVYEKPVT